MPMIKTNTNAALTITLKIVAVFPIV